MGLIIHIILEVAALFALFWTIRTRKLIPAIISVFMIISIVLVIYPEIQNKFYGIYVYMATAGLATVYGISKLRSNRTGAYVIIGMSSTIFIYWLWVVNHWHGNTLVAPFVTLGLGLFALFTRVKLKNELGFLIILAADAIAILLENLLK